MEVRNRKLFRELVKKLALEVFKDELDEITVTNDVAGFSTPKAFGKRKKQKKIGVHEALDDKDLRTITKLIRNVVGDVLRDIWLKRNAWK